MNLSILSAEDSRDVTLVRELFQEYADQGIDLGYQHFAQELAELPGSCGPPSGCLLLARIDKQPSGCVALRRLSDEIGESALPIENAALGRAIAEQLLHEAWRLGYERVRLDTISPLMDRAIALYRDLGFEEIAAYGTSPGSNHSRTLPGKLGRPQAQNAG